MNYKIIILLTFAWIPCSHISSNKRTEQAAIVQGIAADTVNRFDLKKDFDLTNARRVSNYPSSDQDTAQCQGWRLDEKQIKESIIHSRPITGSEWDLSFADYPCAIIGELRQDGNDFRLELNAGSWFIVKSADETQRFGIYDHNFTKLFLAPPAGDDDLK